MFVALDKLSSDRECCSLAAVSTRSRTLSDSQHVRHSKIMHSPSELRAVRSNSLGKPRGRRLRLPVFGKKQLTKPPQPRDRVPCSTDVQLSGQATHRQLSTVREVCHPSPHQPQPTVPLQQQLHSVEPQQKPKRPKTSHGSSVNSCSDSGGASRAIASDERSLMPLLDLGSMVQLSDPHCYGVIRWIGELPDMQGTIAGVEQVS